MLAYIVRRMLIAIPVLLVSTILVFLMVSLSGDPLSDMKFTARQKNSPAIAAQIIHNEEHRLRLDQPLPQRYANWISGVVQGDFGPARHLDGSIASNLWDRMKTTGTMVLAAMVLALLLAIVVGVVSAVRQYSALDYGFTFAGFLFLSMPVFWLAVLLKEFLAVRINNAFGHTFLYTIGSDTPGLTGGWWSHFTNQLGHLILPTLVLAMTSYAAWSRFQRASMLDVLNSDYVRLARAKGLSNRRVLVRHALRTAMIPLTTVVAIDFAGLLSGAIITETVFSWEGMGRMLLKGIQDKDVYVVMAWLLVAAVLVIVFNLIADILYALLDPRIRLD